MEKLQQNVKTKVTRRTLSKCTSHFKKNATKAKLPYVYIQLQLKLIHLFAREIFLIKKLEIKKTKPTFIISALKVEYQVGLVFSISNTFINKIHQANNWSEFQLQ